MPLRELKPNRHKKMHHLCNRLPFRHGLCTVYAKTLLLVAARSLPPLSPSAICLARATLPAPTNPCYLLLYTIGNLFSTEETPNLLSRQKGDPFPAFLSVLQQKHHSKSIYAPNSSAYLIPWYNLTCTFGKATNNQGINVLVVKHAAMTYLYIWHNSYIYSRRTLSKIKLQTCAYEKQI